MELASLTPEGRIVLTLHHGQHTYSELKLESGLSDRWLSKKLSEFIREGIITKNGRWYRLNEDISVSRFEMSLYLRSQSKKIAEILAEEDSVAAIFLFGSVTRETAHDYSDVDLIIVASGQEDGIRDRLNERITEIEAKFHFTVEPLILSSDDFRDNVESRSGGIVYGLAEGYEALYDRTGESSSVLRKRVEQIREECDYLEDVRIWVKPR